MSKKEIKYYKMNGLGNKFVIIDNREYNLSIDGDIVQKFFHENYDQIISIDENKGHKVKISTWNRDGSIAEVCGNATRCIAKLYFDERDNSQPITVISGRNKLLCYKLVDNRIMVNMGKPKLNWQEIPMTYSSDNLLEINYDFKIPEIELNRKPSVLNIGNPHIILWLGKMDKIDTELIGPKLENHKIFPNRINVSFAKVLSENSIKLDVWERGAGLTQACGTAACVVAYASYKLNMSREEVTIELPGGKLDIKIDNDDYILKTGPAELEYIDSISIVEE